MLTIPATLTSPENLLILLVIVLVLFGGAKRLPGLGRGLGQGMREFKDGITGHSKVEDEEGPAISRASAVPEAAPERPREPADAGPERNA